MSPNFLPLLPAYLKVTTIRLRETSRAGRAWFDLSLAPYPATPLEVDVTVSDRALFLLSIADGSQPLTEWAQRARAEFGDDVDCMDEIEELVRRGVIVDAAVHPELRPGTRDRYARHQLFYGSIGADAPAVQRRLAAARVALIGVGGIGTWLSFLLGAAGVGDVRLIDGDRVEESNLTRQLYFTPLDIGRPKVEVARERLLDVNPRIRCVAHARSIETDNDLDDLVGEVDLMILSGDQPADINDIVDRYSVRAKVPWSAAGYAHATAVCGPLLVPGRTGCRRCIASDARPFPRDLPFVDEINARAQVPSFGPVNGLAASMQAKEALAWLGGLTEHVRTIDAVFAFDALTMQSKLAKVTHRSGCERCAHVGEGGAP